MRILTPSLLAAQRSASAQPYVRALFSDFHGDTSRIRFQRPYTGSEGHYFGAAVGASDGSLVRARIDPTTKVLYTQRVANPGPGSDFSAWTSHGTVSASGAVALAVDGASVFLFYVDMDTVTLKLKTSADNGISYGSPATVATASAAAVHLAAAVSTTGDRVLMWNEGATVYRSRFTGGAWGARTAWSNSVASVSGIACSYRGDFNVALCGTATGSGEAKVWACIYGDGFEQSADTWSPLSEVTTATAATNVTFLSPALAFIQSWRLFFVEKYTGDAAYARVHWTTLGGFVLFGTDLWREPIAFDATGDHGLAATAGNLGAYLWLSSPSGVWSGRSPGYDLVDVSADVVEAEVELQEDGGRARIVLRNDAATGQTGRYAGYGNEALGAIQRGARLDLAPGYHTTEGAETPISPAYWVESIEQTTGPEPRLIVTARDGWWLLERWRARRQFVWPAGSTSVYQIMRYVCSRAGLGFSAEVSVSDAIIALQPAFTIHPGESGTTVLQRLLAMVPDVAFAHGDQIVVRLPLAEDDADYAYAAPLGAQTTTHAIVQGRYGDNGPAVNRARVLGAGVYNEAFAFAEIEAAGERLTQVLDLNLTTADLAEERAGYALRAAELRRRRDELRVFGVNCGQELYDVVAITDPQAGMEDARRRVLALSWHYQTHGRPRYDMTLTLGNA